MKIKNTVIQIVSGILLLAGFQACSFMDTTPQDFVEIENFYKTEDDCEHALAGIYWTMATSAVYGENYSCKLSNTDDLSYYTRANQVDNAAVNTHTTSNSQVLNAWEELYKGINNANMLLEHIDSAKIDNDAVRNRIKGEARFLRAYYHYLLVQGWHDVPIRVKSIDKITETSIAATPHVKALDWVISEMEACLPLVDNKDFTYQPGRVKKTVVEGILARVCLWRAGQFGAVAAGEDPAPFYTKARDYAKAVIESGKHKLTPTEGHPENIELIWKNMARNEYDKVNNESMWEVEFMGTRYDGNYSEGKIGSAIGNLQKNPSNEGKGYCYAYYAGTLLLWDLLNEEKDDLRRDLSMAPYTYDKEDVKVDIKPTVYVKRYCGKFRREWDEAKPKNKNFTSNNYPLLRYADILLMYAEAENELNGPADAYDAINQVRKRANVSEYSGLDKEQFRQKVRDERARELCFESLRKFDLIRWGIYEHQIKDVMGNLVLNDSRWGKGTTYDSAKGFVEMTGSQHQFFPIPLRELSSNLLLKQNSFWGSISAE